MKKIVSVLIALVTLAGIANAQISIKKSDVGRAKQMTTLSMFWSWIYQFGDSYYIVMRSDNQFDDSFWLNIGKTKDECIENVTSLLELSKTIGETDRFDINNGEGEVFDVTQYKSMGSRGLRFYGDNYAGSAYILTSNLNKALKWIRKKMN